MHKAVCTIAIFVSLFGVLLIVTSFRDDPMIFSLTSSTMERDGTIVDPPTGEQNFGVPVSAFGFFFVIAGSAIWLLDYGSRDKRYHF